MLAGTGPRSARPLFIEHDATAAAQRVGPHDMASREEVLALLPRSPVWPRPARTGKDRASARLKGAARVLDWLLQHEGGGWQERWRTADPDSHKVWVADLTGEDPRGDAVKRDEVLVGLGALVLSRIVLPSYEFLRGFGALRLLRDVQSMFPPGYLEKMRAHGVGENMSPRHIDEGLAAVAKMVLYTGRGVDQLTAEDVFDLRAQGRRATGNAYMGTHTAWELLRAVGAVDSRDSLHNALRHGQRPTVELVDQYNIQSTQVRNLLVRYLDERRPAMDYASFIGLARELVSVFWADIEAHHPGIDSLRLSDEAIDGWKQRLATYTDRSGHVHERRQHIAIMMRIRGFYLDIQEWAHEDPFWAAHAVPSPIRRADGAGGGKLLAQTTARMHQRVRDRLPHLHHLVDTAERVHREAVALLDVASSMPLDATFEHEGRSYLRIKPFLTTVRSRTEYASTNVVIRDLADDKRINQTIAEDDAFWAWAVIETLRHTGVRSEELTELTHLALVSYRLADTGELVPLLQIVPSKSNEERLLLVSPELASVLASIITRLRTANGGSVPLVARYDVHERVTGPPLPHLFQRRPHWKTAVISATGVQGLLTKTLEHSGLRDAAGEPLHFTPHDFRRMFATEAVSGGLPVHIAARILGHKTLTTTQAYLAVFQDDLVLTYRGYLDRRRANRPPEEYREPTEQEWSDFQQHFELRKVSLGTCGRPYGTPCKHEHACIRCPVLQMDPRQRPRLIEIIRNLRDRVTEARANGWHGEVEGLQISLDAANAKLAGLNRTREEGRPRLVDLGIPVLIDQPPNAE